MIEYNKSKQRKFYDSIKKIHCERLGVDVIFNAKGFHHLFYESDGTPRDKNQVAYRLRLLPLIIPTIKNVNEYEYEEREGRVSRSKDAKIKLIKYWALQAKVGKDRDVEIKVVLRQVGEGAVHFWSVMRMSTDNKKHQHE